MASLGLIGLVGGVGGEMQRQAAAEMADQSRMSFEKWRIEVLDGMKQQEEARAEARDIRKEERGLVSRAQERAAIHGETVQRAPELRQIKAEDTKAAELAKYDPQVTDARLGAEEKSARTKARVEREETTAAGNDPAYTTALRKIAQAKHIEGLGSMRQAELANLKIDEQKKVVDLFNEFEASGTSPERKAQIRESLTVRGIIKPNNEFDTQEVTTETLNDDGSTTKTRKLERRKVDGSAPSSGRKVGESMVVKAGPHKGKTAVWDGKGWKLKD